MTKTRILAIDDDSAMLGLMKFHLQEEGYEVAAVQTSEEGLQLLGQQNFDLALTDLQLPGLDGIELVKRSKAIAPDTEIIMVTGYGSVAKAVEAIRAGAFYYVEKPLDFTELQVLIEKALERRGQAREISQLRGRLAERTSYYNLIGHSRAMQHIYEIIESVAESDANVLIIGESGTGKELVAAAVHYRSLRAKQPFMQVNCAALPKELIESELFGHTKGAFTGAHAEKAGLIARTSGGSLLLDEIGEMPLELQPKLLRVLQERVYYRIGSEKPMEAKFRLIASTNRNPLEAIQAGHLRDDLYYRINTIEIHVPPLRERAEDIQSLAEHFLRHYAEKYQRAIHAISDQAYESMLAYSWPGNVRQLQNVIERAVLMCKGDVLEITPLTFAQPAAPQAPAEIPASPVSSGAASSPVHSGSENVVPPAPAMPPPPAQQATIEQLCKQIIRQLPAPQTGAPLRELFRELEIYLARAAVERTHGNKQAAANLLGIYRPRLYNLLKQPDPQVGTAHEGNSSATAGATK
ncbi:MAG: sigma-54-dependent transcriptional regulator [Blastocatellia bacterium]